MSELDTYHDSIVEKCAKAARDEIHKRDGKTVNVILAIRALRDHPLETDNEGEPVALSHG